MPGFPKYRERGNGQLLYFMSLVIPGLRCGSQPINCSRNQRRHPFKQVPGQLTALIHLVPHFALPHDPLVVSQMEPDQYILGAFAKLLGNGIQDP